MTLEGGSIMRISRKGLTAFFLLVLAGCASQGDVEVMQHDVDELKSRYFNLEKDFGGLKSETREGMDKTLKDYQREIESLRKGTADLQASLESAKVDMQVMAGRVDDANLQAKKPSEDISLLKEDLERRLEALEGKIANLEKFSDEQQKKMTESSAKQAELSPEALYQQGLDSVKDGDTQKGRELLTKFVEKNPNHELAANAHYWIGESHYTEKSYDLAILEFEKVIKNYPGKEKVPAAMLKQAMAFKALGDVKSAKYVFGKLIESFPRSVEAVTARSKLKDLK
jgi:tol-pal system protein YbgF